MFRFEKCRYLDVTCLSHSMHFGLIEQECNCMQQAALEKVSIGIRSVRSWKSAVAIRLVTASISLADCIFTLMKERHVGISAAWHFHVPCCLTDKENVTTIKLT